jgi:type I restriction enzyme R subunit
MNEEPSTYEYRASSLSRNVLTEPAFQKLVVDHLVHDDHYERRTAATDYDPVRAMDVGLLFDFLERTQADELARLHSIYDGGWRETVLAKICNAIADRGLVNVIWNGVQFDSGIELSMVYPRPSAGFDRKAADLYDQNVLSVMDEVYHKEDERIDLVIFLNGLAIFTLELKCESSATGWDYRDAIRQYKFERDCKTRLLAPKIGALAHFAMDLNEVWVCPELKGGDSKFLPFNMGVREPGAEHETRAGNPVRRDGIATAYMWEKVLTKDTVFSLVYDFVYYARDRKTNKKKDERPIFPRFQQLRAVTRIADDIRRNKTMRDYLVEHSAGSGKTNTICWLAHKLAGLYADGEDDLLFDKVLIVTDRIVVDRQLQAAVVDMAKASGTIKVIDSEGKADEHGETSKSGKLARALTGGYRIVVCTMATFLNLDRGIFDGTGARFAVLIDEAHGSTSGETMAAVNGALSDVDVQEPSCIDLVSDAISEDIARSGRQRNVTIVGFTATPTGRTLDMFGTLNAQGKKEAFDLYSMRQAIEEGFIVDVTANYTTYDSFCRVVKSVPDDPELESAAAKRQLAHLIATNDGTVNGNLRVMVNHFTERVQDDLGGKAKAMIVASSREAAVRYRLAYEELRRRNMGKLGRIQALVAFSGDIVVDGEKYTESGMNGGLAEDKLPDLFHEDGYRILIVADKYQTGFDEPLLSAMYVAKKLHGLSAVQTLSRLNRICPPYEKRPYVLDFVNSYEDIAEAFAPYYENTVLENPLTYADLKETERHLEELDVLDGDDVREFYELLVKKRQSNRDKERMWGLLSSAASAVKAMDEDEADKARRVIRHFVKQYAFLIMASPFSDEYMHMEYRFCQYLIREIAKAGRHEPGIDISDKVELTDFTVEKSGEHVGDGLTASPRGLRPPRHRDGSDQGHAQGPFGDNRGMEREVRSEPRCRRRGGPAHGAEGHAGRERAHPAQRQGEQQAGLHEHSRRSDRGGARGELRQEPGVLQLPLEPPGGSQRPGAPAGRRSLQRFARRWRRVGNERG